MSSNKENRAARLSSPGAASIKGGVSVLLSTVVVLTTLGFMFANTRARTSLKIGYVNSATILSLLPSAQNVQAKLDTLVQDWSDTINQMSKEYQSKVTAYERQTGVLTPDAKLRDQHEIAALQQEIMAYRQSKVGQGGALDSTRYRLLQPIRQRIYKAIAEVARREGMQFVFDKNDQVAAVLYADPYYDITYKVLGVLTRESAN